MKKDLPTKLYNSLTKKQKIGYKEIYEMLLNRTWIPYIDGSKSTGKKYYKQLLKLYKEIYKYGKEN